MSNQIYPGAVRGLGFTVTKSPQDAVIVEKTSSFLQTRIVQSLDPIWHWSLQYDVLIDNPLKPTAQSAYSDLQTLIGFVAARRNSYDDFLFLDADDNTVGPGVITQGWLPNWPFALGAIIIVSSTAWQVSASPTGKSGMSQPAFSSSPQTDGGLTWTQLAAVPGGAAGWPNPQAALQLFTDGTNWYSPLQINRGGQFYEDVTDLASAITVYANGTATTAYTLSAGSLAVPGFSSTGLYLNWGSTRPTAPITATFSYYFRVRFEDSTQDFEKWANQLWSVGGPEGMKGKGELKLTTARNPVTVNGYGTPSPPINFPVGATKLVVLYPTIVSLKQGTGVAVGVAGPNAYAKLTMTSVGLFAVSPAATFSGFILPPFVPPGAVKAIYAYTTNTEIAAQSPFLLVQGLLLWTGNPSGQGIPFTGNPIEFGLSASGAGAINFPFSSLSWEMSISGSVPATYSPPTGWAYTPRIYVYY